MYSTGPTAFPPHQPPPPRKKGKASAARIVLALTGVAIVSAVSLGSVSLGLGGSTPGGSTPGGSTPGWDDRAVLSLACSIARDAINQASIDAVLNDAAKIRFINRERLNVGIADGWTDQMLQVVDAATGFASLRNEPGLTDGGSGLRASMHNLLELCIREHL